MSATSRQTGITTGTWKRIARAGLGAILLAGLAGASGCGGVTDARVAARNRASKTACDRANACGSIGPGQSYADYQSCISVVNGDIDGQIWPASVCQQINQQALDVCISAIGGTQCGNGINFLITLGTCSKENVCVGAADPGGQS